jgi:hypothetical protein
MRSVLVAVSASLCCTLIITALVGCSDSGGGGSAAGVAGIEVPPEVSAVAAKAESPAANPGVQAKSSPRRILSELGKLRETANLAADLPDDSDYKQAVVKKFVEIESLNVFGIITTIFNAIQQTNYAEPGNVGIGPYKCLVAWEDEGDGGSTQTLMQTWTISSDMLGGVNEVDCWIEEIQDGEPTLTRVVMMIEQAPTRNDDDTLADLGAWEIRAIFGTDDQYFHAKATVLEDGTSRLAIHERQTEDIDGTPVLFERKGIIYRNADLGYGRVIYNDEEECWRPGGDCSEGAPTVEVAFSYNADYLTVQVEGEVAQSFDRDSEHPIVHRYGLFSEDDGHNVQNDMEFGFGVNFEDGECGWYSSWRDQHQVWKGGETPEDGTTVTRSYVPAGEEATTYTIKTFAGALQKLVLVQGSLEQLEGIPAEIWLSNQSQLRWNEGASRWDLCDAGCQNPTDFTDQLSTLAYTGDGDQRWIFISRWDGTQTVAYVYQATAPAGFYEAHQEGSRYVSNGGAAWSPSDGDTIYCSIGGRTYITYTGDFDGPTTTTGWVEKTLTDFDTISWTPIFAEGGDRQFFFEVNREYYVNNRGANLRITRTAENGNADDYEVFMEVARVAKPGDTLDSVFPDGTILVQPWDPDNSSTYVLEKDPEDEGYLLLKYLVPNTNDTNAGRSPGDIVTSDLYGLRIQGDAGALEVGSILYNWQYRNGSETCGGVTYLIDDSNSEYVLLHEPIRFNPVALPRTRDLVADPPVDEADYLSFSLTFDGNIRGLPDTWYELEKVNYVGSQIASILANNVVIPDGTELVDDQDTHYYVKAVDVGIFLEPVTVPGGEEPDMDLPEAIDLDTDLPVFTPHDLSETPPAATLRYIEGIAVE